MPGKSEQEGKRLWKADIGTKPDAVDDALEEVMCTIAHAREARDADRVRIEVSVDE